MKNIIDQLRDELDKPAYAPDPATAAHAYQECLAYRRGIMFALVLLGCDEAEEKASRERRFLAAHPVSRP